MNHIFKILLFTLVVWTSQLQVFGANPPEIYCGNLPWCGDGETSEANIFDILWNLIALLIQYVAVIAVIAIMLGWIMYLTSSWEEEKTKRAKNVIIWALVWVIVSVSAWSVINLLSYFRI